MLVISRNPNEVVHIGDDITVTVVRVKKDKVTLGFTAPASMKILRSEIWSPPATAGTDSGSQDTATSADPGR